MSARHAAILALATAIAIPAEGIRQWAYRDPVGIKKRMPHASLSHHNLKRLFKCRCGRLPIFDSGKPPSTVGNDLGEIEFDLEMIADEMAAIGKHRK